MRVLIVNRAMGTLFGGGEAFDFGAAGALAARGHRVTVITGRPLFGAPNRLEAAGVSFEYLAIPGLRRLAYLTARRSSKISAGLYHLDNWIFERRVLAWLDRGQKSRHFDVVQCCALFRLPDWLLSRHGIPVVTWLPGPPSGRKRAHLRKLLRRSGFGMFARGATCADLTRQMGLRPGVDFAVVEPGIDVPPAAAGASTAVRVELGLPPDVLLGITVARLVPVKNLAVLIDAIAIAQSRSRVRWLVIGDGPERLFLERRTEARGVRDRVFFLGQASRARVHDCLAAADVFCLTSSYESFSIATLEAMAHGLPAILPAVGYLPELVHRSGGGSLVPPGDPSALADAIVQCDQNRELAAALGARGRRFAEAFDWPHIAERLEEVYRSVSAPGNPHLEANTHVPSN